MARIEKTVFISYRRTNFWTALAVFQNLHTNGYDVFFDYKSIPSGDFEQAITENITSRAHFIVVLSPSALERCQEPGDWLRREIETAIDNKRNIIPLMMEGFDFGSPTTVNALTGKLAKLKKYNAIGIPAEYFDDAMVKLRSEKFLSRPLESIAHPVSETTRRVTESQKSAAKKAAPIEKEALNAQEWFERGYKYYQSNELEEAIRCYTEAINLESKFAVAYSLRGLALTDKGNFDEANKDFTLAINLEPNNGDLYFVRTAIHRAKSDLTHEIADYTEAIRLMPTDYSLYDLRGDAYYKNNNPEKAIEDYSEAIRLNPNDGEIYNSRGIARKALGDFDSAIADYNDAIRFDPENTNAIYNRAVVWEKKRNHTSAIADYHKYLELGGGMRDGDQKEVEKKIKLLKSKLTKKKSVKKKTK